jgi:hypothetical protein
MVNHLPVIGMLFAAYLLVYARFVSRSKESIKIALFGVFLVGLTGLPAYFSGEAAEEMMEHQAGISEVLIESHEDLAKTAFVLTQISAVIGFLGLIVQKKNPKTMVFVHLALVSTGVSLGALGLTAQSGGLINHPEIRTDGLDLPRGAEQGILDHNENHETTEDND